ncbi:Flagellar biosynthesis protein FlhF [Rubripirellula lacrimiformis]|uniref:Flagellar biosynthesis protein FlhF n=1 Tax=Rubripirellula lacrimiformis TaxID=1930273 RepID=A0A517N5Y5_9BACT|nr:flagellar biosynthesis protein FlhF [Rubripirellula lacrimiformis]QDT02534.1 Flagellar biosynthesis protein FlhF [Rubripirellula lacrimiformis]
MTAPSMLTVSTFPDPNVHAMHIRTFRAASLQDALEQIRQQMGSDASVLHTRQVRDGWMGWLGRTYVEVTAGLKDTDGTGPQAAHDEIARSSATTSTAMDPGIESEDAEIPSPDSFHLGPDQAEFSRPSIRMADHDHAPATFRSHSGADAAADLPLPLQSFRNELIDAGVSAATADRWLTATASFAMGLGDAPGGTFLSGTPWLEHLQRTIGRELRIGSPILTHPGDRRIVALVGPTGVGKTTTVAKLAAGFRIEARRRVGLLTIDTFRIAAVQQLKAYAEIMDLPMEVVERPDQMQPALDRLGDVDLILIDTAGRSPRSGARIDQLVDLLHSAQPDETHLVLSSNSSASAIQSTLEGFAPVQPTSAILTKLDETPHTAAALSALVTNEHFAGIPLSYVTNGQQVPDDIAPAEREYLLSRLLPAPVAFSQIDAA